MKKYFIICLVALIVISGTNINAFGEAAVDKQLEASVLKVKDLFDIGDDYDTFDSNISSGGDTLFFYMNWSDSNSRLDSISVTTDSLGNIINYNKYSPIYKESETKVSNYTKEEAIKLAMEFIGKIDKSIYKEIELVEDNSPLSTFDNEYRLSFKRVVNGIPFVDNSVSISVNKYTGQIMNFNSDWERDMVFPIPDGILSIDEGKKAYVDSIGLDLVYKTTYGHRPLDTSGQETKHYLVYSSMDDYKAIDAFTGEVTNIIYYGPYYGMDQDAASGSLDLKESETISPEERKEIEKLSGIIDIKKVEAEARKILGINTEYKLNNKNLYSDYNNPEQYIWSLYFEKKVDNNYWDINISLNAKTLELLSFYKNDNIISNKQPQLTKDESLELAKEYVKEIQPNKIDEIEFSEQNLNENQQNYYFIFTRKIDDIFVKSDSITVTVDAVNKEIEAYMYEWYNGEFPPKGEVIGFDRAYDIVFNTIGYDLKYTIVYDYDKPDGENQEIKLVYAVDNKLPLNIDANSGEILDANSGKPYKKNNSLSYDDIDKSYAKDKIKTLSQYGVGFNSSKFKPKEKIRQKDFAYLLFKSMNSYRLETEEDIDTIYEELRNLRIISESEKSPDTIVTKEEAIKYVIRTMNFEKIAEISGIYASIFQDSDDVSSGLEGYINIAYGLGIINGDGSGEIKPKAELRREDAASIIYKYMFN